MGPSIVIDGEQRLHRGGRPDRHAASMGPSIVIDGEAADVARHAGQAVPASMGPSIVIDGEAISPGSEPEPSQLLQWGRRS